MKTKGRCKWLALLLVLVMILNIVPVTAFAERQTDSGNGDATESMQDQENRGVESPSNASKKSDSIQTVKASDPDAIPTRTGEVLKESDSNAEAEPVHWDVSKSKEATNLDENYESEITLSLPSAEEELATDVVIALDVSKCTENVLPAVQSLLNDLANMQESSGASIRIGIAMYKGSAVPFQELETLTQEKNEELQELFSGFLNAGDTDAEHAVRNYLKTHFENDEYLNTGTNMPAGLMLAKKMLDEDTEVDANRKYMVLISDGSTYLFTHDDDYSTAWSRQHVNGFQGGLYELNWRCSEFLMQPEDDWNEWLEKISTFAETFTDEYDYQWKGADTVSENLIPDSSPTYLVNGDTSIYQAATFYKEMQESGYNCYYCYAYDTEDYYGRNALKSLNDEAHLIDAEEAENIFSGIENDIIFAVGAGSTVEDEMGDAFDFVPGSLKLTVAGKELVSASDAEKKVTYFGDDADELNEEHYRFKVTYDSDADTLTWTINENVSNFATVQLSYKVKLVDPETHPGTYGTYDRYGNENDGTENYGLYTNNQAKLSPVDSNGDERDPEYFKKPTVSYTVKKNAEPESESESESSTETETGTESESGTETETSTESESSTEIETSTESKSNSHSGSGDDDWDPDPSPTVSPSPEPSPTKVSPEHGSGSGSNSNFDDNSDGTKEAPVPEVLEEDSSVADATNSRTTESSPKTGDNSRTAMWLALGTGSAVLLIALVVLKRRAEEEDAK